MSARGLRRVVMVAVVALSTVAVSGWPDIASAATSATPRSATPTASSGSTAVVGQVHVSGASVTSTCDTNGRLVSRTFTAPYDASDLGAPMGAVVSHAVRVPPTDTRSGFTTWDTSTPPATTIAAGTRGSVTRSIALPSPQDPGDSLDVFLVKLTDPQTPEGVEVISLEAPRRCATTTELPTPTVTISAPRCDNTVDITYDATGLTQDWFSQTKVAWETPDALSITAGQKITRTVGLWNDRSDRIDVTLSGSNADTHAEQVSHGGTFGVAFPRCPAVNRGALVPLPSRRIVDTRTGTGAARGAVPAGGRLAVDSRAVVPPGASAVTANLTVTEPRSAGYLQAWSADGPGTASVLNFIAGQTISRSVILPLDANGRFIVSNVSPGSVQLVVDLSGYAVGSGAASDGDLVPLQPTRLLDTRAIGTRAPLAPGATVHIPVVGRAGIGSASMVAIQVTTVGGTAAGYLTAWSGSGSRPPTSSVNYLRGQVVGNLAPTAVAPDGTVAVTNTSSGTVHLVVDVEGWWREGSQVTTGGLFTLPPQRLLDNPSTGGGHTLAPGESWVVDVTQGILPTWYLHGVSAVLVNLTVTQPATGGYLAVAPDATNLTSAITFGPGTTLANQATVPTPSGSFMVTNRSRGTVQVIVDIVAYVTT